LYFNVNVKPFNLFRYSVFSFDFAGAGLSEGDFTSWGWYVGNRFIYMLNRFIHSILSEGDFTSWGWYVILIGCLYRSEGDFTSWGWYVGRVGECVRTKCVEVCGGESEKGGRLNITVGLLDVLIG
jgi:hypothetical protein